MPTRDLAKWPDLAYSYNVLFGKFSDVFNFIMICKYA